MGVVDCLAWDEVRLRGQVLPRGAVDLNNFAACSRYS